ncbi:MAG: hypothetical protein AAF358_10145 [Pseudomonadota bacterium]
MNSSTSSSDAKAQRGIFVRIFLTVLLGMGIALALVQGLVMALGAGSSSLLGRVIEARNAIPRIVSEPQELVMMFGSSMTDAGFSPREFDLAIAENGGSVKSFNFGFGGLNPLFQDYLSRRIREDFEANDRRLKLVMIEFNPFQTTVSRRNLQRPLEESYVALLASPAELADFTLDDPGSGIRMSLIRYLRDGISAEMITTFLWGEPFRAPRSDDGVAFERDEAAEERLREVLRVLGERFGEEYPDFDGSDWYYPWQGGGTIKAERPAETLEFFDEYYDLITTDYRMAVDRLDRVQSADIEELHFDAELVSAFVRIVENFKAISDHVEIIMLPKNTDWIKNPPEALVRQAEAIKQIEAETGLPVRDFQVIEPVSNDMFSDTTHLNRYQGAVAFTDFLVERYAELLTQPAPN